MRLTVAPDALWQKRPAPKRSPGRKLGDSEAVAGWCNLPEAS